MRLIVTADSHFPFDRSQIPDGDVFLHCGDLMYSGYPDEWYPRLDSLAALPHKLKLYVPGNHDFHPERYRGIAKAELRRRAGTVLLDDGLYTLPTGHTILAVPYVTGLPGWAYNLQEDQLATYLEGWGRADIVASHGPMYTVLDAINPAGDTAAKRNHVGSWALAKWYHDLEDKPEYFFHGHIHESYGEHHEWGTSFYNCSLCDGDYKQTNAPIVIDL